MIVILTCITWIFLSVVLDWKLELLCSLKYHQYCFYELLLCVDILILFWSCYYIYFDASFGSFYRCSHFLSFVLSSFQVFHACYTKVSPSVEVDNPQLVAWSESVAESLELDPKEWVLVYFCYVKIETNHHCMYMMTDLDVVFLSVATVLILSMSSSDLGCWGEIFFLLLFQTTANNTFSSFMSTS